MLVKKQEEELEKMKKHYEELLQDTENDHNGKIKELVKEFNKTMVDKEKEFEKTFSNALDKSQKGENRLLQDHNQTVTDLHKELQEKDEAYDKMNEEWEGRLMDKDLEISTQVSELQQDITSLKQQHQVEIWELQEKLKKSHGESMIQKEVMQKQEVSALTQEWNKERQYDVVQRATDSSIIEPQELLHHNQLAISALQPGSNNIPQLQQQVVLLTRKLDEIKEQHRLEIAELQGRSEMNSLQPPLIDTPFRKKRVHFEDQTEHAQNMELINIDLEAKLQQVKTELAQTKIRENELNNKLHHYEGRHGDIDSPPLSPGYHATGPLLQEPTQCEYLKNILYQYMMGRETKTLSRVIGTVVHFNDEQMRKVIAREDAKTNV